MISGRIFDIQRFCVNDGPGIRTNVFMQGCPLRCIWCHNPEGLQTRALIGYDARKCVMCAECARVCKTGAHVFAQGEHIFDRTRCVSCQKCVDACVYGALEAAGRTARVSEIMDVVRRDKPFYAKSGGGLTLTGGEPTAQIDFACALARAAQAEDINVCVETCGYCERAALEALCEHTHIFLYDIKDLNDARHTAFTGVSNARILENLRFLDAARKPIVLRCPLIPTCQALDEHMRAVAKLAEATPSVIRIELEPYHPLGQGKRARFGMPAPAPLPEQIMPREHAQALAKILRANTRVPVEIN